MTKGREEDGVIEATLPKALYRIRLDSGRIVTAGAATGTRQTTVKLIPGDRVTVELSPYDPTRGRIKVRHP